MTVFEWGSGNSTLFFAQRCNFVHSVEDQGEWWQFVTKELEDNAVTNVEISVCPLGLTNADEFRRSTYLKAIKEKTEKEYDVIVIDGADPPPFEWRPICFYQAEQNVKKGGIIIVDDSWRYRQLRASNRARSISVFESIGPPDLV